MRADAPERLRPQLVPRRLPAVLDDPVARADVVQEEVAVRMDDLVGLAPTVAPPLMTVPTAEVVIDVT
jgi:hypothetical protein